MTKLQNSEMLLGLTANSIPNVSEVVQMLERGTRQIKTNPVHIFAGLHTSLM